MTGDWWVISTDGPHHRAGDLIVGPCTREWAEGYRLVSASAVDILPGDQLTEQQRAQAISGDIEPQPTWQDIFPPQTCPHCRQEHPGQTCHLEQLAQPLPL